LAFWVPILLLPIAVVGTIADTAAPAVVARRLMSA